MFLGGRTDPALKSYIFWGYLSFVAPNALFIYLKWNAWRQHVLTTAKTAVAVAPFENREIEDLGEEVASMTVDEIAEVLGKTRRGVMALLTRRGIKCADYDGAEKKRKMEAG